MADPKMVELGLLPNNEAHKAHYYKYLLNGIMTQLVRVELGRDIEQAHMRNRQLISRWILSRAKSENVAELIQLDGKHFISVNDYSKLRELFGELLCEVQRIKSTGDYLAAKELVENYGVKVDANLHSEVLQRYKQLDFTPYKGFVNPTYSPVFDESGEIVDVLIDYDMDYVQQHLSYGSRMD